MVSRRQNKGTAAESLARYDSGVRLARELDKEGLDGILLGFARPSDEGRGCGV